MNNEINWDRGVSKKSKDSVEYVFKNGSKINILAARESSRGQRRTGGLMEECILIDQTLLNEVIIPTMNVDRRLSSGDRVESETVNKSQIYVTTAGWKNSFAYQKLMQLLIQEIIDPSEAVVLGGTWRVPVLLESMNLNGAEMRKMLISLQKDLINIDNYYNLNMNIAIDLLKMLII